jgi:hypothetical protein
MTSSGFRIARNTYQQLRLELAGDVDEEIALSCERETRTQLTLATAGSLRVLWDLTCVRSYTLEARVVIVRLQRFLTTKAARTAYVAADATPRSLALWAARMGSDERACIAGDQDSADAWLAGRGDPNTLVRSIASVRAAANKNTANG